MGQKSSTGRPAQNGVPTSGKQNPFKLFEYKCAHCGSKRPIQYFYRNGVFMAQKPRVVCGECNVSSVVEPFKTVDYSCPSCRKPHKVRLPAKPVPLNMYNVSVVTCNCGFKGEVPVGRLMDISCGHCWSTKRELCGVWTEEGDEVKSHCAKCQDYQRSYARPPQQKSKSSGADEKVEMEYTCDNCFRNRPVEPQELLRNQGLAYCSLCGWVGYPEVREREGCKRKASTSSGKVIPIIPSAGPRTTEEVPPPALPPPAPGNKPQAAPPPLQQPSQETSTALIQNTPPVSKAPPPISPRVAAGGQHGSATVRPPDRLPALERPPPPVQPPPPAHPQLHALSGRAPGTTLLPLVAVS
eukprot:gnl/MRDRNA2_/MRDRNA2_74285_c0_seq1.p1 gnl/MRDRNA2_/MRDRNA2_74285_c0~~gnl/MRDRNA2_/MRDRNA2_74285_c0_seq1.p1  ORF type:complete len:354 (-),score=38.39 gnl/MRDRNA2_/MRDRNA2_74285_c0_seq1:13-1074(-)